MHKNSKPITIKAAYIFPNFPKSAEIVTNYANKSIPLGAYAARSSKSKTATGLTSEEENLLMPSVINSDPSDKDFRDRVVKYFMEIRLNVNIKDGITLETGLEIDNNLPVSKDNLPISPEEYIKFRWCMDHPWVAPSMEFYNSAVHKFFVDDPHIVSKTKKVKMDTSNKALGNYLSIADNEDKVRMYLVLMYVALKKNPNVIKPGEEPYALKEAIEQNPHLFNEIFADENAQAKYMIEELIYAGTLQRLASSIVYSDSAQEYAPDMKSAIVKLRDKRNSKELAIFKQTLKEKFKADKFAEIE